MRVSASVGLVAIVGVFACASDVDAPTKHQVGAPADESESDDVVSTTDPSEPEPTAPPPAPEDAEEPPGPVVSGLAIEDVAVFQAVKVPVVQNGALVATGERNAPVVARRPGLVRVYVKPGASWKGREVTAELRLVGGDKKLPVIRDTKRIDKASKDEELNSTFNLEVPADSLPAGVKFQVSLTADDGEQLAEGTESEGRFPRDGSFQDLGATVSGKISVVLVPVRYDADGSGREPDVSDAQLELYRKVMMQRYPTSEVEVKTHAPYPWKSKISANGSGFQQVLRAMHQLRNDEKPASDVYYYGVFAPANSFKQYCQTGCVTGLSMIVDADDPQMRASVGLGFTGQDSADTMAHELGHAHGRAHAPCGGPQGVDPKYPYPQAQIGVWGYDIFGKTFIAPNKGRDMMGYCPNLWVSDYTYEALFQRISQVSLTKREAPATPGPTASYRVAAVDGDGDLTWDGDLDLDEELTGGSVVPTRYLSENGVEMMTRPGRFFRFDHLPGGFLMIPKETATPWKAIKVDGYMKTLARDY